jgi:hypothetical protein
MKSRKMTLQNNTSSDCTESNLNEEFSINRSHSDKIFEITKNKKTKGLDTANSDSNEEIEGSDEDYTMEEGNKRISAGSKVNFNKLSENEKDNRLKNLSVLITRLRKKIRNLETKCQKNVANNTKSYIDSQLSINGKDSGFNLDHLIKALKVVKDHNEHHYEDEKNILENFIVLLAEERLSLNSIHFKKICSQIRMFLDKEKINFISKKGQKIIYSFKERDIFITPQEYDQYKEFKNNERVIRTIMGINPLQGDYPEKIVFSPESPSPVGNMKAPLPRSRPSPVVGDFMNFLSKNPTLNQPQMTNPLYFMMPLFKSANMG